MRLRTVIPCFLRATFGLVVCLASVTPALAIAVGDKLTRLIEIGGKQIPLPDGEWTLAGLGTQPFRMPALGAFGAAG